MGRGHGPLALSPQAGPRRCSWVTRAQTARRLEISVVSGQGAGGPRGRLGHPFVRENFPWLAFSPASVALPHTPAPDPTAPAPQLARNLIHPAWGAASWPWGMGLQQVDVHGPPAEGPRLGAGAWPVSWLCVTLKGPRSWFSLLKNKDVTPWSAVQASPARCLEFES